MKELTDLRTEKTKLFDLENGRMKLVAYQHPIHYKKGNMKEWEDIDTSIGTNKKINKCPYDIELLKNKVGYKGTDFQGKKIELELTGVKYVEPIIEGNKATYVEVEKDVDFVIIFGPRRIQANRILKSDKANKTSVYRSFREEGITGKVLNLGVDKEGRNTKLKITEQKTGKKDEKFITQIFDGKVMKMNPVTRKREWSDDVTYPVVIDPTTTTGSLVNNGQGFRQILGATTSPSTITSIDNLQYRNQLNNFKFKIVGNYYSRQRAPYLRFNINNIPKGSTINSAVLSVWGGYGKYNPGPGTPTKRVPFKVQAKDSSNPGVPTNAVSVFSPASPVSGTVTTTFTNTISPFATKGSYLPKQINVQNIVDALVTNYDYSTNTPMLFLLNTINQATGTSPTIGYPTYNKAYIYAKVWGTSKDAELEIVYTAPPTVSATYNGNPIISGVTTINYGIVSGAESKTFVITNSGQQTLNVVSTSVPVGFTVTQDLPPSVAIGATANLIVRLDQSASGNVSIVTDDPLSPFTFGVTGAIKILEVSYNGNPIISGVTTINYGTVSEAESKTFVITNIGQQILNVVSTSVPVGFTVTQDLPPSVAIGATANLIVRLNKSAGIKSGNVSIVTNDPLSPFTFGVTGVVEILAVSYDGTEITSGQTTVVSFPPTYEGGSVSILDFLLSNYGSTGITVTNVIASGGFSLVDSVPFVVSANNSRTITIQMSSDSIGVKSSQVRIVSNDGNSPFTFPVSGNVRKPWTYENASNLDNDVFSSNGISCNYIDVDGSNKTATITWKYINGAYVAATTVCRQELFIKE